MGNYYFHFIHRSVGRKKTPQGTKQVQVTFTREVKVRAAAHLQQKVTATKAVTAALKECG